MALVAVAKRTAEQQTQPGFAKLCTCNGAGLRDDDGDGDVTCMSCGKPKTRPWGFASPPTPTTLVRKIRDVSPELVAA
jgi:hypothetical protein